MDIQGTSVLTISKLADGKEMVTIFIKENDDALPYVLEYGIKTIKNSKNMAEAGGLILTYLARHAPEKEECWKIFNKVNKDFDNLSPFAQKCLKGEFPNIFGIL